MVRQRKKNPERVSQVETSCFQAIFDRTLFCPTLSGLMFSESCNPGCAAARQPWAAMWNAFGVKDLRPVLLDIPNLELLILHSVAQVPQKHREIYFRTIKSGCRVEERQFETLKHLMNCVAVYSIIAWRIMYLCRLGRECPDLECEVVFESSEWKSVYAIVKKKDLPFDPPRLNEMIRMIASLGGYVLRKSIEPRPQTLWIGLQRVHDLSTAWEAFGLEWFFPKNTCVVRWAVYGGAAELQQYAWWGPFTVLLAVNTRAVTLALISQPQAAAKYSQPATVNGY